MKGFKQCSRGHFYKDTLSECAYCPEINREKYSDSSKLRNDTVLTPLSFNAKDLNKEVNIILKLDTAPDNLKRFIEINREYYKLNLKDNVSSNIGCNEKKIPKKLIEKINELESLCNSELLKKNIISIGTNDFLPTGDFYLSNKTISSIVPDTLLTQILGNGSKLDLLYKDNNYLDRTGYTANTAVGQAVFDSSHDFGNKDFQDAREEIESKKYLAISLLDNSANVLCLPDREKPSEIKSAEAFFSENISIFNPVIIKNQDKEILEYDFNNSTYIEDLTELANNKSLSLYFKVSRQNIALALGTLFNKISELHKNGFVHCDLKPQNILCSEEELIPFDPIKVKIGDVSAGMTTNFCAPEQILTQPVSPATDIYNIGLIILSIIDGIVYGKTSNYMIPRGETQVETIKLLTDPMIYIDHNNSNIQNKEGIPFWKSFLERCLAFEQQDRFSDMDSFIIEYNKLLDLYPLKNSIDFNPNFGNLSLIEVNGKFEPAWFIK